MLKFDYLLNEIIININKLIFVLLIFILFIYVNNCLNQKNNTIIKNKLSKQIFNSTSNYVKVNSNKTRFANYTIRNLDNLIIKLKLNTIHTKHINIIFADYYPSKSCYDKNAYILFEYYLNNKIDHPFYIINEESDFYKTLLKENKTKNLILYQRKNITNFYQNLYEYLKDAKIIINSYSLHFFQLIASYVPYINFLKINHGIHHFKSSIAEKDLLSSLGNKANIIYSSPLEYEFYVKKLKYKSEQIHNSSLIRYERFQYLQKNNTNKKCILISFTYRPYSNTTFEKSQYKNNVNLLLNNQNLIKYLNHNNIDLIYIPHHEEIDLGKNYSQNIFKYAKIKGQNDLENDIEQCNLFITDYSSISFDFMFQNKPVLFYDIDKSYNNTNDSIYFGNYFTDINLIINKIKFYVNNSFVIDNELKNNYDSIFMIKSNIINKTIEIINNILRMK